MGMNLFDQLLPIKERRENNAARKVVAQRLALQEAETERDSAQRRLDDYHEYANTQEGRIFKALFERPVKLRDIEDAHAQVLAMRAKETDHREALQAAEAERVAHEKQLETDRTAHRFAVRKRDKFVDLADVFNQEVRAQAEYAAEAEIEEVAQNQKPGASLAGAFA